MLAVQFLSGGVRCSPGRHQSELGSVIQIYRVDFRRSYDTDKSVLAPDGARIAVISEALEVVEIHAINSLTE